MQNYKEEKERKKMNQKLIKETFFSELKDRKIKISKIIIDICTIFIASFSAHKITDFYTVSSFWAEIFIFLAVMAVITFIGTLFDKTIKKISKKG